MPAQNESIACKRISSANLLALAILNMRRHGLRAVVNVVGIAIAVAALAFFLAFYRGTYEGVMFASVIDYATSHGQFMSASFDDDDPDVWLDRDNLVDAKVAEGGVLLAKATGDRNGWEPVAAPRLMSPAFAGDGSRKAAVTLSGVDFAKERKVLAIDERMLSGTFGGDGVVIGKKLAQTLSLAVGDEIRIQANTADSAPNLDYWRIAGIYSTGYPPMDRDMVLMDLAEAQAFLGADGKINKVYCRLTGSGNSIARERNIGALETDRARFAALGLAFKRWQEYAKPIVADAKSDSCFFLIFIGILLFLSLSTMAGAMRVTVYERKREIGMLRASGWLQSEIARQFLMEALLIGVVGSLIGCIGGGLWATWMELRPIAFTGSMADLDIPNFKLTCDLQARDLVISFTAGFLTALFAGIMPALSGARMPILSALAER